MSYQALNLVIHLPMDAQIRLLGDAPNTPEKDAAKEAVRRKEL